MTRYVYCYFGPRLLLPDSPDSSRRSTAKSCNSANQFWYLISGRMHITGQKVYQGKSKFVDYMHIHKIVLLAVVETKDNKHPIRGGMQQGLAYAADDLRANSNQ